MGSLSFETTDENIELIEALLEGLNGLTKKLSEKELEYIKNDEISTEKLLDEQERWIESGCMKKYNTCNF